MLLESYKKYLLEIGVPKSSVSTYTSRIRRFFREGFSENDLLGAVEQLIAQYSRGGAKYSPSDHGNTRAALLRLKDFKMYEYVRYFSLSYERGFMSFVPKDEYLYSYGIKNFEIHRVYKEGFIVKRMDVKPLSKQDFYSLIEIFIANRRYLSLSDTVASTVHGDIMSYSYSLTDRLFATRCKRPFDGDEMADIAMEELYTWLKKHL